MATAAQVIQASLQKILVQATEQPIQASEAQDFIFMMNNYMLALDAEGISLGYTEVTKLSDDVTVPPGALRGMIYNLAIEAAPEYDGVVTPAVAEIARQGMRAMRKLGQSMGATKYPCTLPIGSGNEDNSFTRGGHHYYDCDESAILAETTGSIGLETNTNTVAGS